MIICIIVALVFSTTIQPQGQLSARSCMLSARPMCQACSPVKFASKTKNPYNFQNKKGVVLLKSLTKRQNWICRLITLPIQYPQNQNPTAPPKIRIVLIEICSKVQTAGTYYYNGKIENALKFTMEGEGGGGGSIGFFSCCPLISL